VAVAVISLMLAMPSIVTLIAALGTVIAFAIAVTWMLARVIGPEA
jgi:hypothetical protein